MLMKEEGIQILKLATVDRDFKKVKEALKNMNIDLHVIV
jgi:predicted nucleic acid-binding protein